MRNPVSRHLARKLLLLGLVLASLGLASIPAPSPLCGTAEASHLCYWAFYETYYDENWFECGFYNSCTGERQYCDYTYRNQEIFQCCQ